MEGVGGAGGYDVYMVNHGLGTGYVVASVSETASPYSMVEVEVRRGQWVASGTAAGTGVHAGDSGSLSYVNATESDWTTFIFADITGDDYRLTVTG